MGCKHHSDTPNKRVISRVTPQNLFLSGKSRVMTSGGAFAWVFIVVVVTTTSRLVRQTFCHGQVDDERNHSTVRPGLVAMSLAWHKKDRSPKVHPRDSIQIYRGHF